MNEFKKGHRREPIELQLTAMIDIFSMITIFLIFGTVFGASEINLSPNMSLPRSISRENIESAPQVVVNQDEASFAPLNKRWSLKDFTNEGPALESVKNEIRGYVSSIPNTAKQSGVLLSVVADKKTPYKNIFDVVKVFRESGFETLLFVTTGKADTP